MSAEPSQNGVEVNPLTEAERDLLEKVRAAWAAGYEEIPEELVALSKHALKWSLDDPDSVVRWLYFMARDPYYRREVEIIEAELDGSGAAIRGGTNVHSAG